MKQSFLKPEQDKEMNPVDYFNRIVEWDFALEDIKNIKYTDNNTLIFKTEDAPVEVPITNNYCFTPPQGNKAGLNPGKLYSKFMMFSSL